MLDTEDKKTIVISLGGSIIVPDSIDKEYLKSFAKLIRDLSSEYRFIIIAGGGRTSRAYLEAAKEFGFAKKHDLDWIGIHATRLNARLVWTMFHGIVERTIATDPRRKMPHTMPVLVAGGWKPGFSSDYCAVSYAIENGADSVINITDVDYVYDKDPKKHKDANPIKKMSWESMKRIVGGRWLPGLHLPFDPIASASAEKNVIRVCIVSKDINNLKKVISGRNFKGTVIG